MTETSFLHSRPPLRSLLRSALVCLGLTLAVLLAFQHVFEKEFIAFDTDEYVINNPYVRDGFSRANLAWAMTAIYEGTWQPLTWLSHQLDTTLYGLAPAGHQASNLLIHIANTLLLFALLLRMTGRFWPSALVAALFCLHPLRVESVAWVAERKGLLSSLFGLCCLHAYVNYARSSHLARYCLVALCLALGLMAKPALMALPGLLLVLDFWPLCRVAGAFGLPATSAMPQRSPLFLLLEKVPLTLLALGSSFITYAAQKQIGAMGEEVPFGFRLANCVVSYVKYIGQLFWPSDLAPLYPYPTSIPVWQWAAAGLLLGLITACLVWGARRAPYLLAGWLWFLISLAPAIGLVVIGNHAMADRFTYLPGVGLVLALVWAGDALCVRWPKILPLLAGLALAVLLALGLATRKQTLYWRDTLTLFQHTLEVTQENSIAQAKVGVERARREEYEAAIAHFDRAVAINPANFKALAFKGQVLEQLGRHQEAALCYQKVLVQAPNDLGALNNLGIALARLGMLEAAVEYFQAALVVAPQSEQTQRNLQRALDMLGAESLADQPAQPLP